MGASYLRTLTCSTTPGSAGSAPCSRCAVVGPPLHDPGAALPNDQESEDGQPQMAPAVYGWLHVTQDARRRPKGVSRIQESRRAGDLACTPRGTGFALRRSRSRRCSGIVPAEQAPGRTAPRASPVADQVTPGCCRSALTHRPPDAVPRHCPFHAPVAPQPIACPSRCALAAGSQLGSRRRGRRADSSAFGRALRCGWGRRVGGASRAGHHGSAHRDPPRRGGVDERSRDGSAAWPTGPRSGHPSSR